MEELERLKITFTRPGIEVQKVILGMSSIPVICLLNLLKRMPPTK